MQDYPSPEELAATPEFCRNLETANQPWPLRGFIWGPDKFMGIMVPNEDIQRVSGILLPKDIQARPKACMIMKMSDDITDYQISARKEDRGYRHLSELKNRFSECYKNNLPFYGGPGAIFLAGSADECEYFCPQPPRGHWMRAFWNEKRQSVVFCTVVASSVIWSFELRMNEDKMVSNAAEEARDRYDRERLQRQREAESEIAATDESRFTNIGFIVKDGASPNRV